MSSLDPRRVACSIADDVSHRVERVIEEALGLRIDPEEIEAAEFVTACLVGDRRLAAILAPRIFKGEALHRVDIALSIGGAA